MVRKGGSLVGLGARQEVSGGSGGKEESEASRGPLTAARKMSRRVLMLRWGARGKRPEVPQTGEGRALPTAEHEVEVTVLEYNAERFLETVTSPEGCRDYRDPSTVTWVDVDGVHDTEVLQGLAECFDLHPLVLEDIVNTTQRPKLEDYGEYIYLVARMLRWEEDDLTIEQVSIVLGPTFVLSFQEQHGDVFDPMRDRLRKGVSRARGLGPDYLAYWLIDVLVDNYFLVLEKIGDRVEMLEEEVVAEPTTETLRAIHELKREILFLRQSVWPLREVISNLQRGELGLVTSTTTIYLRDLYDHTIQVIDAVESLRDTTASMLDIYLSTQSNRMNEIMKVLTIIATIFMPLTFIAGIYGMNFAAMPELHHPWGYPVVLLVMAGLAGSMAYYFRRKGWL